jgi:hypothetical protein
MYEEGWTNGRWDEKIDERPCIEDTQFKQVNTSTYMYIIDESPTYASYLFVYLFLFLAHQANRQQF